MTVTIYCPRTLIGHIYYIDREKLKVQHSLLHEAIQEESVKMWFNFHIVHSEESIAPEIVLRIHHSKPVNVPKSWCTTGFVVLGINIALSCGMPQPTPCAIAHSALSMLH